MAITRKEFLQTAGVATAATLLRKPIGALAKGLNDEIPTSSHPAGFNTAGINDSGLNTVTPASFSEYFNSRAEEASMNPDAHRHDRMHHQLSTPVGILRDRDLDFDYGPLGFEQGLGFEPNDLNNLRTEVSAGVNTLRKGQDGRHRGWAIVPADKLGPAVLDLVDSTLILRDLNPHDSENHTKREALFKNKIYGDLDIQPLGKQGEWYDLTPNFTANETNLSKPNVFFGDQHETPNPVTFCGNVEVPGNGTVESTFNKKDSKNPLLVTGVWSPREQYLRVEAFSLANSADPLNPQKWSGLQVEDSTVPKQTGVDGGRFVPRGNKITIKDTPTSTDSDYKSTATAEPTVEPTLEPTKSIGNPGNDKAVGKAGECPNGDCSKYGWPENGNKGASNGNKGGGKKP